MFQSTSHSFQFLAWHALALKDHSLCGQKPYGRSSNNLKCTTDRWMWVVQILHFVKRLECDWLLRKFFFPYLLSNSFRSGRRSHFACLNANKCFISSPRRVGNSFFALFSFHGKSVLQATFSFPSLTKPSCLSSPTQVWPRHWSPSLSPRFNVKMQDKKMTRKVWQASLMFHQYLIPFQLPLFCSFRWINHIMDRK